MEIIKREYTKASTTAQDKGKGKAVAVVPSPRPGSKLYQYNQLTNLVLSESREGETGHVDGEGEGDAEPKAQDVIAHDEAIKALASQGRKRPKAKHVPEMSVMLATRKVAGLYMKLWTYVLLVATCVNELMFGMWSALNFRMLQRKDRRRGRGRIPIHLRLSLKAVLNLKKSSRPI